MRSGWLAAFLVLGYHTMASAQNTTTTGTVTVTPSLEALSVTAAFTGDANGNNSVTVQFQKHTGDTGLHTAIVPFIDRRATLGGAANPYVNQARVSIVGLLPNTSYDVRVAWSDPDGVGGTNPITTTTSTLTTAPPTGSGTTRNVTNNSSQSSALSAAAAGDTVTWASGNYNAFTITRSGTPSAWIIYDGGGVATINGSGVSQNIQINANYVILRNFILSASDFSGIVLGSNQHHVIISGNTLRNVSAACAADPTGAHYSDSGIVISNPFTNAFVLNNSITSTSLTACIQTPLPYNGPGTGIAWASCSTCVIKGNTVTGAFRDAISSDDSNDSGQNVDIYNNTVSQYVDDGIESKGDNVNVRLYGNIISSSQADSCIAANTESTTNQYGPIYIFRNVCRITGTLIAGGGSVFKITPAAPMFVFHNSMDATNGGAGWTGYAMTTGPFVILNNIVRTTGSMSDHAPTSTTFDYTVGTVNSSWAYLFGGTTTYDTLAAFRSGTGLDTHSLNVDPQFSDVQLHLSSTSPAINAGVFLNNFNTADSAWPFRGPAPDVGAYEVNTVSAPTAPTNLRIVP
jgi:hypothetical protein